MRRGATPAALPRQGGPRRPETTKDAVHHPMGLDVSPQPGSGHAVHGLGRGHTQVALPQRIRLLGMRQQLPMGAARLPGDDSQPPPQFGQ